MAPPTRLLPPLLLGSPGTGGPETSAASLSHTSSRPCLPSRSPSDLPSKRKRALLLAPSHGDPVPRGPRPRPRKDADHVALGARSVVCRPDASSHTFPPVSAALSDTRDPSLSHGGPVGCLPLVRRQALCWREARVSDTHACERWLPPGGLSGTAPHPPPAQRPCPQPLLRLVGDMALLQCPRWTPALARCPGASKVERPRAQTSPSCPWGKCQPCRPGDSG